MVTHANARFLFRKCSCGKICRGQEFRKHSREQRVKGDNSHTVQVEVVACIPCTAKCEGERSAFFERHGTCPSGNVGNRFVRETIEERETVERARIDLHEHFGFEVPPPLQVDLDADLALSSDTSSEEEFRVAAGPVSCSTPNPNEGEAATEPEVTKPKAAEPTGPKLVESVAVTAKSPKNKPPVKKVIL